jgi:hypothetical protein
MSFMLSVTNKHFMLSVMMLNVVMLVVVMPIVVMLNVWCRLIHFYPSLIFEVKDEDSHNGEAS